MPGVRLTATAADPHHAQQDGLQRPKIILCFHGVFSDHFSEKNAHSETTFVINFLIDPESTDLLEPA